MRPSRRAPSAVLGRTYALTHGTRPSVTPRRPTSRRAGALGSCAEGAQSSTSIFPSKAYVDSRIPTCPSDPLSAGPKGQPSKGEQTTCPLEKRALLSGNCSLRNGVPLNTRASPSRRTAKERTERTEPEVEPRDAPGAIAEDDLPSEPFCRRGTRRRIHCFFSPPAENWDGNYERR